MIIHNITQIFPHNRPIRSNSRFIRILCAKPPERIIITKHIKRTPNTLKERSSWKQCLTRKQILLTHISNVLFFHSNLRFPLRFVFPLSNFFTHLFSHLNTPVNHTQANIHLLTSQVIQHISSSHNVSYKPHQPTKKSPGRLSSRLNYYRSSQSITLIIFNKEVYLIIIFIIIRQSPTYTFFFNNAI